MKRFSIFLTTILTLLIMLSYQQGAAQTYSGSPNTLSGAVCPSGTGTGSGCALTFSGGIIKAYISSISGNRITIKAVKCDGLAFGGGTIYLKTGDVCGTVLASGTPSGSASIDLVMNVNYHGTQAYVVTFNSTANGTPKYYSNNINVTGAPILSLSSCMSFGSPNLAVGETYNFTTAIRNAGSNTWTGILYLKINGLSPSLSLGSHTINAGSSTNVNYSFVPTMNQIGTNIPAEIFYQTGGSGAGISVPDGTCSNPMTTNIAPIPALPSLQTSGYANFVNNSHQTYAELKVSVPAYTSQMRLQIADDDGNGGYNYTNANGFGALQFYSGVNIQLSSPPAYVSLSNSAANIYTNGGIVTFRLPLNQTGSDLSRAMPYGETFTYTARCANNAGQTNGYVSPAFFKTMMPPATLTGPTGDLCSASTYTFGWQTVSTPSSKPLSDWRIQVASNNAFDPQTGFSTPIYNYAESNVNTSVSSSRLATLTTPATYLNPGTYYWTMHWSNGTSSSAYTTPQSFTIACEKPINLTYSNVSSTGFKAQWDAVSGASTYKVFVYKATGGLFIQSPVTVNSNNFLEITGLEVNTQYFFIVQARCGTSTCESIKSDRSANITTLTVATTRILGLSPTTLDFGTVDVNQSPTQTVTVSNTGNSTLSITGVTAPSGFTTSWSTNSIAAGQSAQLTVTFTPTTAIAYSGTITFTSDKTSGGNIISVTGTGNDPCVQLDGTITRGGNLNENPSVGSPIQFGFQGYVHATSILWTFPNATPATSDQPTPTVVFNQAGTYNVQLTASNSCSSVTKTFEIKIIDYSNAIGEFQLSDAQLTALDPIGIATGGYLHGERDLTLFGLNNLTFSRNYNSRQISYNKAFGYGWHHNFEYWLDNTSNPDLLTVYHGDGHQVYYVKQPNGTTKLLYNDITDSLIINANATYTLLQRDGGKMNFDASGKATSIEDVFANTVTFGYTANNLTSITSSGRSFRLTYNSSNKIITLSDGQRTTYYGYHASGDLAYTAIEEDTMRYTYNGNHELEQVRDPKGFIFVKNVYQNGRVIEQRDAYDTPHYLSYAASADGSMVTTVRDVNNYNTVAYHNGNFNLTKYVDELGKIQTMTHYANGALNTYTDQNNYTTTITRNAKGDPLSIKNHLQRAINTTFNNMGLPTGITDLLGTQTRLAYIQNRLDTMYLPNGTFIKMTYTPQGLTQNVKDPKGNTVETRTYNSFGDLIQTNTLTGNYYFGQDNLGRITSVRAGEDTRKTWRIEYNHRDQILKMTTPLGTFTQNIYDKNGYVTASKDLTGYWTYYEYDKRDRLIKITNAKRESTQLGYDLFDRLLFIKDNNNEEIWRATYNPRGEMIEEQTPQYGRVQHRFDDAGRWLSSTNALNYSISATYNELNLATEVTNEQGYKTKMTYNDGNQTTKMTYPDGTDKQFAFHPMGWLNKVTDAIGGKNELFFDKNGNVDSVRNAKNNIVSTTYDVANRPLSSTDGITSVLMTWEQQGIKTVRDGNNMTSTYNRDLNDRVTERIGTDNTFERLKLNADGVLDTLINEEGAISVKRDSLHRPVEIKDIFGNTIKYSWTTIGQLATTEYPSGRIVERTYYRPSGLPKEVKLDGQVLIKYFYTLIGQLDSTWVLNGTTTKTYYNAAGVIIRRLNRLPNGTIFQENNRQLDSMNQVKAELVAPVLSPLFTEGQTLATHKIDDGLEQLNGVTVQSDGNGNIKSIGTAQTYTWKNNRLTAFSRNGTTATFSYDGFGTKVKRLQNGIETRYINDFIQSGGLATPIEERDAQNQLRVFTILGAFGEPILRDSGGTRSFYHFDTEGNTIALTNATATITDKYGADEFGAFANHTGSSAQSFRFMGAYGVQHEMEDLYYVRARWMDVAQGRFLSKDPYPADFSNTQSNNRFVYALNNAMTWVDPSGLYPQWMVDYIKSYAKGKDVTLNSQEITLVLDYTIGANYVPLMTFPQLNGRLVDLYKMFQIRNYASNFAQNIFGGGANVWDGTQGNAIKHATWQSMMTIHYGAQTAEDFAFAHEENQTVDLNKRTFIKGGKKDQKALMDRTIDYLNNNFARDLAASYTKKMANKEIVGNLLAVFYNTGFHTVTTTKDSYIIKQTKLTKSEYDKYIKQLGMLDEDGNVIPKN